jgi:hypothetical protein
LLDWIGIEKNPESRYAAYVKLLKLDDEPLLNYLKKISDENKKVKFKVELPNVLNDLDAILDKVFDYVVDLYSTYQLKFIKELEKNKVLDDFYLTIFYGAYKV